jgi:hypothetical protein
MPLTDVCQKNILPNNIIVSFFRSVWMASATFDVASAANHNIEAVSIMHRTKPPHPLWQTPVASTGASLIPSPTKRLFYRLWVGGSVFSIASTFPSGNNS